MEIPGKQGFVLCLFHPVHSRGSRRRSLVEQGARPYLQRLRQAIDDLDRRIASAAFDIADVGPVHPGLERKLFLRPPVLTAESSQILRKALAYVHAISSDPCRL